MGIEKVSVDMAKETADVLKLVNQVVRDARAGKSPGDIASGSVGSLVTALSGVDQIGGEISGNRRVVLQTVGYYTGDLADAILGIEEAPVMPVLPLSEGQ